MNTTPTIVKTNFPEPNCVLPDHPDKPGFRAEISAEDRPRMRILGYSKSIKDTYWTVYDLDGYTLIGLCDCTTQYIWWVSNKGRSYIDD